MAGYYARLNTNKLKADLAREMRRIGKKTIEEGLTRKDKIDIGDEMLEEMKRDISRGISPIFGYGRFPGYKAVMASQSILRGGRAGSRSARARRRSLATARKKEGYPYTVRGRFPNKRERPVNLYLSGDMLNSLEARPRRLGLEFGYYKAKSALKEQGHREGVGGQPSRPTIPVGSERLNRSIYNRLIVSISRRIRAAIQRSI